MAQIYTFLDIEPFNPATVRDQLREQDTVPVRRPLYGLEIGEDKYATLQVLQSTSENEYQWRDLINSSVAADAGGVPYSIGTANLFISMVKYAQQENYRVVETFGGRIIYTYGSAPIHLQVQAVLLKSKNFPWRAEWLRNYNDYLRAGKTVDASARAYLTVEDTIYEGHIVACDIVDQAEQPTMVPLQFVMYVTNVIVEDVGGLYTRRITGDKQGEMPVGTTRGSVGEFIVGGPERPPDRDFAFDRYGNLILEEPSRPSSDEVSEKLSNNLLTGELLWAAAESVTEGVSDLTREVGGIASAAARAHRLRAYRHIIDEVEQRQRTDGMSDRHRFSNENASIGEALFHEGEFGNMIDDVLTGDDSFLFARGLEYEAE
jgi:hypothetical protein